MLEAQCFLVYYCIIEKGRGHCFHDSKNNIRLSSSHTLVIKKDHLSGDKAMFSVSDKARNMVQELFTKKQGKSSLRIMLSGGGRCGTFLALAPDTSRKDDEFFEDSGITYLINRRLFELTRPIYIDAVTTDTGSGFFITAHMPKTMTYRGPCCGF